MKKYVKFLLIMLLPMFMIGCSSDDGISDPPVEKGDDGPVQLQSEANLFTWNALNLWYFWQADVTDLDDSFNDNQNDFYTYLNRYSDPADLFETRLRFPEDRFTFYAENYQTLVESQQGIFTSNGLEYGLARFADNNDVYGYVRYIIPNSNSASADIQRGEIFTHVDGTQLTLDNYQSLLFGSNATYTLGMADISSSNVQAVDVFRADVALNGKEVTLTKEAGLTENPVFIHTVIEQGGAKIGYLMYNGFTRNFDGELNDVFGDFVSQGVTDLVLDLRYNSGGSVNSARYLSSMIYGTNTNDLFIKQRWNDKIQSQLSDAFLEDYFAETVSTASGDVPLNTLNLSKVYVLTTRSSASASELVINGLDPYIDVIQIGGTTRGKNEFSITLVDNPGNSYIYSEDSRDDINPNVSWALQPLTGRNENSVGFFDYTSGFDPEIPQPEFVDNLGTLGDPTEPLLARAIQEITGVSARLQPGTAQGMEIDIISSSKMQYPLKDNMYLQPGKIEWKN